MAESSDDPHLTPLAADASAATVGVGSQLGKYELLKLLAVGGMAEVFVARAVGMTGFQKLVAVKRILPQLAREPGFVELFLDEARLAATLQHPNIAQTYDVGVSGQDYFIAMEYLHGEDLRSILRTALKKGVRLPLENVLQIGIALCAGLHYAHEKEGFDGQPLAIVHRDVSPGNVLITYEGEIKLLDFGIANAATPARETKTGALKGKLSYMSPEQARNEPLDRRSDLFAAGVVLYEISVGRKLFRGGSDYEILKQIVDGQIDPPHTIDPSCDAQLEKIVMRALARAPGKRYQTALEMQLALEAVARERGLFLSTTSIKQLLEQLFGKKLDAWREAQRQGRSLVEHLELVAGYEEEESIERALPLRPWWRRRARLAAAAALALLLGAGLLLRPHGRSAAPPVAAATPAPPAVLAPPAPVAPPPVERPVPVAAAAQLKVVTHPHGAQLLLDGVKRSEHSPATLERLAAGEHVVVAQLAGYKDVSKRLTVGAAERANLTLFLVKSRGGEPTAPVVEPVRPPAPAPVPQGDGTLVLASNPWCSVSVDGAERGQTPIALKLAAGRHAVTLTNPEYKIRRQIAVTIEANQTLRKKLDFTE